MCHLSLEVCHWRHNELTFSFILLSVFLLIFTMFFFNTVSASTNTSLVTCLWRFLRAILPNDFRDSLSSLFRSQFVSKQDTYYEQWNAVPFVVCFVLLLNCSNGDISVLSMYFCAKICGIVDKDGVLYHLILYTYKSELTAHEIHSRYGQCPNRSQFS